jgi:hypothetical protein
MSHVEIPHCPQRADQYRQSAAVAGLKAISRPQAYLSADPSCFFPLACHFYGLKGTFAATSLRRSSFRKCHVPDKLMKPLDLSGTSEGCPDRLVAFCFSCIQSSARCSRPFTSLCKLDFRRIGWLCAHALHPFQASLSLKSA